ncbi:MAG: DUF192 domain-containing protein [archaeon]|nr:DUF192 domain-containing protein [archaeon]
MTLTNITKNKTVIERTRIAVGFFSQLRGLMFEKKKNFDYALVFPLHMEGRFSASIHCLFVFFPIDVVFLDREKKVVDIKKSLMPFTPFCIPSKPAKYFVELPAGKSNGVEIGDQLEWK